MNDPVDPSDDAADASGETIPEEPISDDDYVIRRIEEVPHLRPRPDGDRRISAAAFSASSPAIDPEQGMSCNSQLIHARKADPLTLAPDAPVLARLSVRELRQLNLKVVHRPRPGDDSHCNVLDVKGSHRKKLLQASELIRCPPDVHKD